MPAPEEVLEAARGIDVDRLAFEHLWPMVMLDRVCSPAAEYGDAAGRACRPTNPKPKKTRRGPRVFPPDQPVVWEVH